MAKIHMLSEDLIGRIAAGEVVERPAAAIKELVENSLDAGATRISVEIRDGGLTDILVTDNGSGIDTADLRLAFERHATSKIRAVNDLDAISTLGFRGEALASIAAVSRVTLTTRTRETETAVRVRNEGGRMMETEEAAAAPGTRIRVQDLFYNAPVRRGFMKKTSAEAAAVNDLMVRMILSRPDVSFRFISDGKTVYQSPGDGKTISAMLTIYGAQAFRAMRQVQGHARGLIIDGYVGIGDNARGNRNQEFFFINHRVMQSPVLSQALETACRERVMIGKFPVCALQISIPYEAVDVNVHPNKLEVRFRDEAAVSEAVTTLVLEALKDRDALERPVEMTLEHSTPVQDHPSAPPPVLRENEEKGKMFVRAESNATVTDCERLPEEAAQAVPLSAETDKPEPVFRPVEHSGIAIPEESRSGIPVFPAAASSQATETARIRDEVKENIPLFGQDEGKDSVPLFRQDEGEQVSTILPAMTKPLKIFGALFDTFILIEYEDHLLMVDQHAVHERLLFDRLMSEHAGQNMSQGLLVPLVISVTHREQKLLEENRELLESVGMEIERFGENEAAVRSLPVVLGEAEGTGFIRDVIGALESGRAPAFEQKRSALLQTACKHAVKGGEKLTEDQLRSLVEEMIEKKVTPTCPHGRPLVVSISHNELDRKFKRIQG